MSTSDRKRIPENPPRKPQPGMGPGAGQPTQDSGRPTFPRNEDVRTILIVPDNDADKDLRM